MKISRDAILIAILGIIIGLGINSARNLGSLGGLPINTPWPDNRKKMQLELPPSYDPKSDTLISLEDAYNLYLGKNAIFIDAREPLEYNEGHIKGALNFPFEQWDAYWETVRPNLNPGSDIVVYCGGLDCELSLFSARELKSLGYPKSYTFFGGWQKWSEAGLPVEKTEQTSD